MTVPMTIDEQIARTVADNDVVLFMKGTKMMPQCGFSQRVVQILTLAGVTFTDVNVLADGQLREAIKTFSNWPTIPQLYVKGEFQGGCDIITEMAASGELGGLFERSGISYDTAGLERVQQALSSS
jgi:monothiol glutaredoxin